MWYDKFSLVYDWLLEDLYKETRSVAVAKLNLSPGQTVLDIPCGTGLSQTYMQKQIGDAGTIVAVDRSSGMLAKSKRLSIKNNWKNTIHAEMDATKITKEQLNQKVGLSSFEGIFCGLGLTAIDNWEQVFHSLFDLLKPGGRFVIYDVHSEKNSAHRFAVELVARAQLSRECWKPLQEVTKDFDREILSTEVSKFGGHLYVANGTKSL